MPNSPFIWQSEVRGYELDLQGIVNNAVYLQYLDHTRVLHLASKDIDWQAWHDNGYNLVVHHIDLQFKQSLRQHDHFYVTSRIEKSGRIKIVFYQSIYKNDHTLIATAINTCICVDIATGKPSAPPELMQKIF